VNVIGQHLTQVRPAQIEHPAEVAERLDDTERHMGGDREVDAPVHAFERGDRRRMFRQVTLPGDKGLGTGKRLRMPARVPHQPFDALGNRLVVDVLH
jgi:hypothetical protein